MLSQNSFYASYISQDCKLNRGLRYSLVSEDLTFEPFRVAVEDLKYQDCSLVLK